MRQIIAMGGGGFSMEPENPLLDRYIIEQARRPNPTVCFVPTASGDSEGYIARFLAAFEALPCHARHLSLFRQPADLESIVEECDVFYVGGGNTRNMLAVWRASGFDVMLRRAFENGALLCGLSAGAICWFEYGHADSSGKLDAMECLGILAGSCTPHYDGEPGRRPSLHALMQSGTLPAGYALEDGVALHFKDESLSEIVSSRRAGRAFHVSLAEGRPVETPLQVMFLGESQ